MKWPELVPGIVCTTPIRITFEDGITEDGEPKESTLFEGMCNYTEAQRQIMTAERQLVQLQAKALLNGDIAPGERIAGTAIIGAGLIKRRIYAASRARNLDGTVNFTQLDLI